MGGSTPADVLTLTTNPDDALALMGDSNRIVRDDFAGPGGWSTGIVDLLKAHDLTEVALEWDASACLTRVANGHVNTLRADVAAYPVTPFLGRTIGYIGSPPCQTFSMAGNGSGREHLGLLCAEVRRILLGLDTYEEAMRRLGKTGALDRDLDKRERAIRDALPEDERDAYVASLDLVDPRNGLILIPARVIRALLDHDGQGPTDLEWVALEQVPPAGAVFDAYANALRELGFSVAAPVINAADYGVPQTRERKFVIASRVRTVTVPEPTHARDAAEDLFGPGRLPWVSMARALGWTGPYELRQQRGAGMVERYGDRRGRTMDEPAFTLTGGDPTQGGNVRLRFEEVELVHGSQRNQARRRLDEPAATIAVGHDAASFRFEGHPDSLDAILEARLNAGVVADAAWSSELPATTVVGSFCPDVVAAPGYRVKVSRQNAPGSLRITEAEGGILQGFPADYAWQGTSKGKRWEQIGNVVCPPVARRVVAKLLGVPMPDPAPWHAYAWDEAPVRDALI